MSNKTKEQIAIEELYKVVNVLIEQVTQLATAFSSHLDGHAPKEIYERE